MSTDDLMMYPSSDLIGGYSGALKTYILELTEESVGIIAQALHIYLASEDKNKAALKTLEQLSLQTNCIEMEPQRHKVYTTSLDAPDGFRMTKPIAYIPSYQIGLKGYE